MELSTKIALVEAEIDAVQKVNAGIQNHGNPAIAISNHLDRPTSLHFTVWFDRTSYSLRSSLSWLEGNCDNVLGTIKFFGNASMVVDHKQWGFKGQKHWVEYMQLLVTDLWGLNILRLTAFTIMES